MASVISLNLRVFLCFVFVFVNVSSLLFLFIGSSFYRGARHQSFNISDRGRLKLGLTNSPSSEFGNK